MQQQLVPHDATGPAAPAPTYIVHHAQYVALTATAKKKTTSKSWDLKASALYRLSNIPGTEDLPEICQTLPPLTKENTQPNFEISFRESARVL